MMVINKEILSAIKAMDGSNAASTALLCWLEGGKYDGLSFAFTGDLSPAAGAELAAALRQLANTVELGLPTTSSDD